MIKCLRITALSTILILVLSSCSKNINTSLYQDGLKGNVKSVVVNTLSTKLEGNELVEDKPNPYKNYIFNYTKKGYRRISGCFNPKGDIIYTDNYSYKDSLKTIIRKNMAKMLLQFELVKRVNADSAFIKVYGPGNELLSTSYVYYKKGRIAKKVESIVGDTLVKNTILYKYNNKKELISKTFSDINGVIFRKENYEIKMRDSHKNWTKRLQTIENKGVKNVEICKRGIEYYE